MALSRLPIEALRLSPETAAPCGGSVSAHRRAPRPAARALRARFDARLLLG